MRKKKRHLLIITDSEKLTEADCRFTFLTDSGAGVGVGVGGALLLHLVSFLFGRLALGRLRIVLGFAG